MTLVIGHSWVRRLSGLNLAECRGFDFICKGGATFISLNEEIEQYFSHPLRVKPNRVFVFLGSNDLDIIPSTAEVWKVERGCEVLGDLLKKHCPEARLVFAQVEDRFCFNHLESLENIRLDFKAKSNKFNKWLNLWKGKDSLFIMKGVKGFSDPCLYARDGIHLNYDGNLKLAKRLADF